MTTQQLLLPLLKIKKNEKQFDAIAIRKAEYLSQFVELIRNKLGQVEQQCLIPRDILFDLRVALCGSLHRTKKFFDL